MQINFQLPLKLFFERFTILKNYFKHTTILKEFHVLHYGVHYF